MEVIFIVHSFSILNIVQDKKDFLEMAMTQSPKLYLICALLALSVDLMKGFIDLCSTQPERAPIFSKYANFQFGLKVQFHQDVPNAMHN